MAVTNFDKPVGTEIKTLSDQIANKVLVNEYTATIEINANAYKDVSLSDMGISAIAGYSMAGVVSVSCTVPEIYFYRIGIITGSTNVLGMKNTSNEIKGPTLKVRVLFIHS